MLLRSRHVLLAVGAPRAWAGRTNVVVYVTRRGRATEGSGENKPGLPSPEVVVAKPPLRTRIWKRVKEEAHHYWVGTKLLGRNMKLSSKLLLRVARGEVLSRREKMLLEVTVADTIRLMPFIVIAVVPFLEFALPVLLKVFPNMLPSTYTTKEQETAKRTARLKVRLEMAKFLQSATARMLEDEKRTEVTEETAQEFLQRASKGLPVTNAEILRVGKLLKHELALENIDRDKLNAVARFFGVQTYGPKTYVIYQLERRLKQLREDDAMIAAEGIEKLTLEELTQANFRRGMHVEGRTREQMEQQLEDWMELADSDDVPPFLLLLSRSFATVSGEQSKTAQEAISQLVKDPRVETMLTTLPDQDDLIERKLVERAQAPLDGKGNDLTRTFQTVDKDRDGSISVTELKELMQQLGESFEPRQIEKWLQQADTNQDGRISFKEFIAVMRQATGAREDVSMDTVEAELRAARKEQRKTSEMAGHKPIVATIDTLIKHVEQELSAVDKTESLKDKVKPIAPNATTTMPPPPPRPTGDSTTASKQ